MRALTYAVSTLFHPLFMPTVVFACVFYLFPTAILIHPEAKSYLLGGIFIMTSVIPIMSLFIMHRMGVVTELSVDERSERTIPLIFTSVLYMVCAFIFNKLGVDILVVLIQLIVTISVILVTLINLFWKISAHAIGVGGVVGVILRLCILHQTMDHFYIFIAALVCCGLVLSSRLYLNAHRPMQVYLGFLFGVIASTLSASLLIH